MKQKNRKASVEAETGAWAKDTVVAEENGAEENGAKARAEAKKQEKKERKARLAEFVAKNRENLGSIADDILFFAGKQRRVRVSSTSQLRDMLVASPHGVSEIDIFKALHFGRPEMAAKTRMLLLTPNPADRVWVAFDEKKEVYRIVGKGEKAPEGWTGFQPSAKEEL